MRMGSVLRQSAALFGSNLLLLAGGYGFKIFLARTVGAEGLGLFALAESLTAFALLLVVWEIQQAVFRFTGEFRVRGELERMRRLVWAALWQVLGLGLVVGAAFYLTRSFWAERIFGVKAISPVLAFFALMLLPRGVETVSRMVSRGYREVLRVVAITTVVAFPLKVAVSVVLIRLGLGLTGWLVGETVAYFVSAGLLTWLALAVLPSPVRRPLFLVRQEPTIYGFTATMVGRAWLGIGNRRLGTLLLGIFLPPEAIGIYSVALTTAGLMDMLQSALNGALAPHFAELHGLGRKEEMAKMYYRVTRWDLMAVMPVFAILAALSEPLMALFGDAFRQGAVVLAILALGELVNVGSGPVGILLTMAGFERVVLWVMGLQLAVNASLLLFLLPLLGLPGAALAFAGSTAFMYCVLFVQARKRFPIHLLDGPMWRLLLSGLGLAAVALAFHELLSPHLGYVPLLLVSGTVLSGIWFGWAYLGLMDGEDRRLAGEAVRGATARFAPAAW